MSIIITIVIIALIGAMIILCMTLSSTRSAAGRNVAIMEQQAKHLSALLGEEKARVAESSAKIQILQQDLLRLSTENSRLNERNALLMQELDTQRAESEERFRLIAGKILKETTVEMRASGEQRIGEILNPLSKNIEEFKRAMEANFITEAEGRAALKAHIDTLRDLNQSIGREARELSVALRGNSKVQGDWGEHILTSLLEKSGLQEGLHYTVQQTRDDDNKALRNEDGNLLRPDVVFCYPDGKKVVIDSKVSLKAFTSFINSDHETDRKNMLDQHVRSVRKHIDELAAKDYPRVIGGDSTADFSLMFIPHEPAYIAAMQGDSSLWDYAYNKRVVIVSPTHLLSVLRLLSQIWQQDKINRNTLKIAEESGKMLDKLFAFKEEMDNMGKALENAGAAHEKAMKHLFTGNGNVARRAATLIDLGAKTKKSLPKSWEEN